MTSADFRCYNTATGDKAATANVAAGSTIGVATAASISHPGVANIYMAKAPAGVDIASWDGAGQVWFKVHEVSAVTDGGKSISWPSQGTRRNVWQPDVNYLTIHLLGAKSITFTLPKSIPDGQYLVRIEHIALHSAGSFGGAQTYISCSQINVTGGGSGTPGPLVSIPGVYTGRVSVPTCDKPRYVLTGECRSRES